LGEDTRAVSDEEWCKPCKSVVRDPKRVLLIVKSGTGAAVLNKWNASKNLPVRRENDYPRFAETKPYFPDFG